MNSPQAGELNGLRVLLLSTVHTCGDQRITWKEGLTLAAAGASVIVVARKGGDIPGGIRAQTLPGWFHSMPRPLRALLGLLLGAMTLRRLRPDVVHVHDPELIPLARVASLLKIRFVYDAHEDLVRQTSRKKYLKSWMMKPARNLSRWLLRDAGRVAHGIVAATPLVASTIRAPTKTAVFRNLPFHEVVSRLETESTPRDTNGPATLVVLGGIQRAREVDRVCRAVGSLPTELPAHLVLAGPADPDFVVELLEVGKGRVKYLGALDRESVWPLLQSASIGICILPPFDDYFDAYPVKLFEYLAVGLPVIVSNYGEMQDLVVRSRAGISVDPRDETAIMNAIASLLSDPARRLEYSDNARRFYRAELERSQDPERLIGLYQQLL